MLDGAIFVYRFINTDFSGSLYAILQVAALLKGTYLIAAAHYVRLQLVEVLQLFSRNYERSNCLNLYFFSVDLILQLNQFC